MALTVNDNITHSISPILLLLGLPIILAQLPREVPQYSVALGKDPSIQLQHGDIACRIHLRDLGFLVFWIFLKGVADILVGNTRVFPHESQDLTTTT